MSCTERNWTSRPKTASVSSFINVFSTVFAICTRLTSSYLCQNTFRMISIDKDVDENFEFLGLTFHFILAYNFELLEFLPFSAEGFTLYLLTILKCLNSSHFLLKNSLYTCLQFWISPIFSWKIHFRVSFSVGFLGRIGHVKDLLQRCSSAASLSPDCEFC